MRKHLIFFLFFALAQNAGFAQTRWVQFFVNGLHSENDCRVLEQAILSHEGIESVRSESHEGNLLIFIKPGFSFTEETLVAWINTNGLEAACYRTGIVGIDPIVRIRKSQCSPIEIKK